MAEFIVLLNDAVVRNIVLPEGQLRSFDGQLILFTAVFQFFFDCFAAVDIGETYVCPIRAVILSFGVALDEDPSVRLCPLVEKPA